MTNNRFKQRSMIKDSTFFFARPIPFLCVCVAVFLLDAFTVFDVQESVLSISSTEHGMYLATAGIVLLADGFPIILGQMFSVNRRVLEGICSVLLVLLGIATFGIFIAQQMNLYDVLFVEESSTGMMLDGVEIGAGDGTVSDMTKRVREITLLIRGCIPIGTSILMFSLSALNKQYSLYASREKMQFRFNTDRNMLIYLQNLLATADFADKAEREFANTLEQIRIRNVEMKSAVQRQIAESSEDPDVMILLANSPITPAPLYKQVHQVQTAEKPGALPTDAVSVCLPVNEETTAGKPEQQQSASAEQSTAPDTTIKLTKTSGTANQNAPERDHAQ